ncbi:hypothetical protein D3Z36_07995 [Lachnospiraceae bacterium]|nr:hypothetical protein [Lachnospiraceae bacterium]
MKIKEKFAMIKHGSVSECVRKMLLPENASRYLRDIAYCIRKVQRVALNQYYGKCGIAGGECITNTLGKRF